MATAKFRTPHPAPSADRGVWQTRDHCDVFAMPVSDGSYRIAVTLAGDRVSALFLSPEERRDLIAQLGGTPKRALEEEINDRAWRLARDRSAESFVCPLCGQRIDDRKPCGCNPLAVPSFRAVDRSGSEDERLERAAAKHAQQIKTEKGES